jgi:hypothetical protein
MYGNAAPLGISETKDKGVRPKGIDTAKISGLG